MCIKYVLKQYNHPHVHIILILLLFPQNYSIIYIVTLYNILYGNIYLFFAHIYYVRPQGNRRRWLFVCYCYVLVFAFDTYFALSKWQTAWCVIYLVYSCCTCRGKRCQESISGAQQQPAKIQTTDDRALSRRLREW